MGKASYPAPLATGTEEGKCDVKETDTDLVTSTQGGHSTVYITHSHHAKLVEGTAGLLSTTMPMIHVLSHDLHVLRRAVTDIPLRQAPQR